MRNLKVCITDEEGNVLADFSMQEQAEEFNNDPDVKAEGLEMSEEDAMESLIDITGEEVRRINVRHQRRQ